MRTSSRSGGLGNAAGKHQFARARAGGRERNAAAGGRSAVHREDDVVGKIPNRSARALDLGHAGRKASKEPSWSARASADRGGHLRLDPRMGIAAVVVEHQRELLPALSIKGGDGQCGETLAVERRRHGEQRRSTAIRRRVERQGKREVAVEAALVHLVEQQRRTPTARDRLEPARGTRRASCVIRRLPTLLSRRSGNRSSRPAARASALNSPPRGPQAGAARVGGSLRCTNRPRARPALPASSCRPRVVPPAKRADLPEAP